MRDPVLQDLVMRLRIPPFLPPYAVLLVVVAYAIGSLWVGLGRLDAITRLSESTAHNAATLRDLGSLLNAVNDIETAGRLFVLTEDKSLLELFERGRREVPLRLSSLRDRVRDDGTELALIEALVPLIAESTMIAASGIERKRSVPEQSNELVTAPRGKEVSDEIRSIVASLELRERGQFAQAQQTLVHTIGETRRDLGIFGGLTLLLVILLFLAVRRLRSFIHLVPGNSAATAIAVASDGLPAAEATEAGVAMLLRDAMLRAQVAEAAAPSDSRLRDQLRSVVVAVEKALSAHASAYEDNQAKPDPQRVVRALAMLAQAYSSAGGLTIVATIDQSVTVADAHKAFLIMRSAAWALEAITLRKRVGNVTLQLASSGGRVVLRIHALTDNPRVPVALTPREREEANALRQGVTARAGAFDFAEGPAGMSLTLTLPADA